ncbi:M15 family metallopeptidase [Candidatus Trichorickettsia mobilis]|uniref:M15 family metallopeptidase n=1 Tax=Candidatus Trichorickettsia mobilis TaxID=1346319 RepID=UPI00292F271C|nr:M15 family metallopeptidase [Candidatus Trichorickettsia mobilis]
MMKFYSIIFILLFNVTAMNAMSLESSNTNLPEGFVYLHEVDPSIILEMKYAGNDNFIGSKIDGYIMPVAILTKQAAEALKAVQKDLLTYDYSLVVYDAYRPNKAVQHFVRWSETNDTKNKIAFYPYVNKAQIIPLGYIAAKSAHSRGSTVDLTIINVHHTLQLASVIKQRTLTDGSIIPYHDDGTIDMGSSFDLFDEVSHHDSRKNIPDLNNKRNFLKEMMIKHGFIPYAKEWWHYTLANEPFPDRYFDFDVK